MLIYSLDLSFAFMREKYNLSVLICRKKQQTKKKFVRNIESRYKNGFHNRATIGVITYRYKQFLLFVIQFIDYRYNFGRIRSRNQELR